MPQKIVCPQCKGYGKVFLENLSSVRPCIVCKGEGEIGQKTFDVWTIYNNRKEKSKVKRLDDMSVVLLLAQRGRKGVGEKPKEDVHPSVLRMAFPFKLEE
jgi:DnaJ-class molecular chaperone